MRRAWKIAAVAMAGFLTVIVLLGFGILIFGNTAPGRRAIEDLTARLTGGNVKVAGLGGFFPSHLTAAQLQLRDDHGVWLTARRILLDWSPLSYLAGRLQIDSLRIGETDMFRLPHGSSTPSAAEPSIPRIDVGQARIDVLRLGAELAGAKTTLALNGGFHLRSATQMSIDADAKRTEGDGMGEYHLHLRFDPRRMDATLNLHEPANGPLENILGFPGLGALSAQATLAGPRNAERLMLALQAGELHGDANGSLNLQNLSADIGFDFEGQAMQPRPDLQWRRVQLRGRWQGNLQTPIAQAHLEVDTLQLPGQLRVGRVDADLAAKAGGASVQGAVSGLMIPGDAQLLAMSPLKFTATMRLNDAGRPLEVSLNNLLFALRAQIITQGRQSAQIDVRIPDLAPLDPLDHQQLRGSAQLKAQLRGSLSAAQVSLEASAALVRGKQSWSALIGERAVLQASASLDAHALNVDKLNFTGAAISLNARGSAERTDMRRLRLRWDAALSDLGEISPTLAGRLEASGSIDGPVGAFNATAQGKASVSVHGSASGELTARVSLHGLPESASGTLTSQGTLDGAPLRVDGALERTKSGALHAVIREAAWKSARLDADVVMDKDGPPLGQLHASMAKLGDLAGLIGAQVAGSVDASLELSSRQKTAHAQLRVDATGVAYGTLGGDVHLAADGAAARLPFKLSAQMPQLRGAALTVEAGGTVDLDSRKLMLDSAMAAYHGQQLRLSAPSRVDFGEGLSVDELRLEAGAARVELGGQIQPELSLRVSVRNVQPALVNVFAPHLLTAGTLGMNADLHGKTDEVNGLVNFSADGVRFADDAALGIPALNLRARAKLLGSTADLDGQLDAGSGSRMKIEGRVPIAVDGAIDMKVNGAVDVGLLNPLLEARGQHATGRLDVDANVTGSVQDPQIGGTVTLAQATLRDYGRGISLTDIKAEMSGSGGTLQIKSLTAAAAPGSFSVTGSIGVLEPKIPVDLKITGKNAQPIASKLVTANLNADLHVSGSAREQLDIAGTVHLNRTLIGIPNGLPPNVAVLDVRRRGKPSAAIADKPLVIGLDVAVEAPQEILVQGRGLDAEMRGGLYISGTTDAPLVSGGFDLQRGSFSLASNKLNFTEGRVGFNGAGLKNKIDPTLDFTAQTTLADVTATLVISGFADAPQFAFSSTPSLPQDEIMARLLFGTNAASLSALQLAQIGAALASLSGVGGGGGLNPLVKIQRSLGLDRLNIGAGTSTSANGESSGASIEAGRYVSKRVYIEAKQSTGGSSQLGADIDLTKRLKLQTRIGTGATGTASAQGLTPENDPGSSVGLTYQFEY